MQIQNKYRRILTLLIHFIAWAIVLLFPILMDLGIEEIDWSDYLIKLSIPLSFLLLFYLNYYYLIDKYLFKRKLKQYIIINLLTVIVISCGMYMRNEIGRKKFHKEEMTNALHLPKSKHFKKRNDSISLHHTPEANINKTPKKFPRPPIAYGNPGSEKYRWRFITLFLIRDVFSLVLIVGLTVAIKITWRWYDDETARRELEKSKTEAELKNLKNQINPHFLLNTLNNIYALIAFDTEKAQEAVQELSKMLRYVLYDNQANYVPLIREAEFIKNYVELMKIRLSNNISVTTNIVINPASATMIAPLIFISLIENAFKHGISPTEKSFINIQLTETEDKKIICKITNSYHPKNETDKSGSGIGLEQVSKRLELHYKGRYIWHKGISENDKEYESLLIINPDNNDFFTETPE